jgi:hypothetical protein
MKAPTLLSSKICWFRSLKTRGLPSINVNEVSAAGWTGVEGQEPKLVLLESAVPNIEQPRWRNIHF